LLDVQRQGKIEMKKDDRGLKLRFETKRRRLCGMPGVTEKAGGFISAKTSAA
jgi:hypothetical protein